MSDCSARLLAMKYKFRKYWGETIGRISRIGEKKIPLISRELFFGNPDRITTRISQRLEISFLAPVNGVFKVWIGPTGQLERTKPVTNDTYRGIRRYYWGCTNL